jgi:hypothetical protein
MSSYSDHGWKFAKQAYAPAQYTIVNHDGTEDDGRVVYAVRALYDGKATDSQQRLVWEWLMFVTGQDDISFRPGLDGQRETDFAEGKRFVGQQLRKMLDPVMTPRPKPQATERGKR